MRGLIKSVSLLHESWQVFFFSVSRFFSPEEKKLTRVLAGSGLEALMLYLIGYEGPQCAGPIGNLATRPSFVVIAAGRSSQKGRRPPFPERAPTDPEASPFHGTARPALALQDPCKAPSPSGAGQSVPAGAGTARLVSKTSKKKIWLGSARFSSRASSVSSRTQR